MSCGFHSPSSFQYGLLIWTHMREYQSEAHVRRTIEPQMVIELMEQIGETVLFSVKCPCYLVLNFIQLYYYLLEFEYITYITCVQVVL